MQKLVALFTASLLLTHAIAVTVADEPTIGVADGHPWPSCDDVEDIHEVAAAIRASQPAMQRGAWEWDRLLSRYIDGGRKEGNARIVLQAYFRSILDRGGKGDRYATFFSGHGAWGSGSCHRRRNIRRRCQMPRQ